MAIFKTSNPALGEKTFTGTAAEYANQPNARIGERFGGGFGAVAGRMTLNGTINRTGILLVCVIASAAWTWNLFIQAVQSDNAGAFAAGGPWMLVGLIGGFICAMVTIFKKEWSPVTAPLYALLEGLALGGISAAFELRYPGIAIQAVGLTFATLFAMLFIYRTGIIRVTEKFRIGIFAATGGIAVFYLLEMVLSFFGVHFAAINGSGAIGIGFSLIIVGIAALNLVLDFDFIEKGVQYGAPKYMEWYGAFGIMVTLIWLYLEILRLLAKMNRRN